MKKTQHCTRRAIFLKKFRNVNDLLKDYIKKYDLIRLNSYDVYSAEKTSSYTKLMREQGVITFQNEFKKEFISTTLHKSSFGLVMYTRKAQIGQSKQSKSKDLMLHGFILCRIDVDLPNVMWIDLVCFNVRSKLGTQLIESAEIEIRKNKEIKLIQLFSIPDNKLKHWYMKLGYSVGNVILHNEYKPKAYQMLKFI